MGCGASTQQDNTNKSNNKPQTNKPTNDKKKVLEEENNSNKAGHPASSTGGGHSTGPSNTASNKETTNTSGTNKDSTTTTTTTNPMSTSMPQESAEATPIDHTESGETERQNYVLTMDNGDEYEVIREDGQYYYKNPETSEYEDLGDDMLQQGSLREVENDNITFERFVANDSTVFYTHLAEDGNRYYVNFETSEWEQFTPEMEADGYFVDQYDYDVQEEQEYDTFTDSDGKTYTLGYFTEEVKYYWDEELNQWVKFPENWEKKNDLRSSLTRQSTVKDLNEEKFRILQLEEEVEELQMKLEAAGISANSMESAGSITATRKQLEEQVEEHEKTIMALESARDSLQEKLDAANQKAAQLQAKLDDKEQAASQLGKSQNKGLERIQNLETELKNIREQLESSQAEVATKSGKLDEKETELKSLREQLQASEKSKSKLELAASTNAERVEELNKELEVMRNQGEASFQAIIAEKDAQLESVQKQLADKDGELSDTKHELDSANAHLEAKQKEQDELQSHLDAAKHELNSKREEFQGKEEKTASLMTKIRQVQMEYLKLKPDFDELKALTSSQLTEFTPLFKANEKEVTGTIKKLGKNLDTFKAKYRAESLQRKLLYNKIQEMRGNIRVFLRCRGLNQKELDEQDTVAVDVVDDNEIVVTNERGDTQKFEFDHVYGPNSTQREVYADTSPTITSVLDGYNVCIFAYGQTGAGKTYTMMGPKDNRGVNFQALEELFGLTKERSEEATYHIFVASMEIYNEKIRDLLNPEESNLDVRQGPQGNYVPGLNEKEVTSMQEIEDLIAEAEENRTTESTAMNAHSSRSHSLLRIRVEGKNLISNAKSNGVLTLVDLAGSERASRSQAQGQRLVEAAAINNSLSTLGTVIGSLQGSKKEHIPYRNSKLTYLLADSLGGDSKTLMFLCVSPAQANVSETLSSLGFGARVRNVVLGPATRHTSMLGKKKKGAKKKPASSSSSSSK